jgi:hypothetical protein
MKKTYRYNEKKEKYRTIMFIYRECDCDMISAEYILNNIYLLYEQCPDDLFIDFTISNLFTGIDKTLHFQIIDHMVLPLRVSFNKP